MNGKSVASIALGLVSSLLISGVAYYLLFLETFDLFGESYLRDPESVHAKIFYTAIITSIFTVMIAILLKKMHWRNVALGFIVPAAIGLVPIFWVGPTYLNDSNYYEEFNQEKWLATERDRLKMARYLVVNKKLVGLTKEQVIEHLGTSFHDYGNKNYMAYYAFGDFCGLGINFNENKVTDSSIWVTD
jgi:hypothetical protein